ncbi:hypothetical protein BDV97DRAFT_302104 [Delphinella strobiligena]|nr:hypothetical protein BDV97DRAFT_302104 [Delphinella strobiligena]
MTFTTQPTSITSLSAHASNIGVLSLSNEVVEPRCYSVADKQSLDAFKILTSQITMSYTYTLATSIQRDIPIYDASSFNLSDEIFVNRLQDELHHLLVKGPGVYVIQNFYRDKNSIDSANSAYDAIIARELATNGAKGDHFATGGSNSRIWNSFSKHCFENPESFFKYYSNPLLKVVCESYLGPAYRLTTQVNIVRPGGKPQVSHRDYHLGFQTAADCAKWPKAVHQMSALLTLQGAVAHSDMPLESGPTRMLPYSQLFEPGFMAYRHEEFDKYFLDNWVSLPLKKGDAVFFNPALFHSAGENTTQDVHRSANLIQVSSAFGKPMEVIDALPLVNQTWDLLQERYRVEGLSTEVDAFIGAVAEGYSFPTNLDNRPPGPGGMAPESEQDLLRRGLTEGLSRDEVMQELIKMRNASKPVIA